MDLGRFHYAIEQLAEDYKRTAISTHFDHLISRLNQLSGDPSNKSHADAYRESLEEMRQKFALNERLMANNEVRGVIKNLDLNRYIGNGLFKEVKETISENQLSPSLAAQALSNLKNKIESKFQQIIAIDNAFSELGVDYEVLDPGSSELTISIPVEQDNKTLSDLSFEAKEWNQIIATLSEVFDETRPTSTIRSLTSGSWVLYLSSTPLVLWGVAVSLRRINQILAELLKGKDLINQLRGISAPTAEIEKHQQDKFSIDLKSLAIELVGTHYTGSDVSRKNELEAATSIALKKLALRIASGSKVELQIASPTKTVPIDASAPTPEEENQIGFEKEFETLKLKVDTEMLMLARIDGIEEVIPLLPFQNDPDIEA